MTYLTVFFVSFFCILLELFLTRILNLKAWNHLVYIIIPFAILGYGIGANIQLLFRRRVESFNHKRFLGSLLIALAIVTICSTLVMIKIPIMITYLESLFQNIQSIGMLLVSYTVIMVPFVIIGYIIVYIFSVRPKEMYRLYLFDLVGAGLGAAAFFVMIDHFDVVRSIFILSAICFCVGLYGLLPRLRNIFIAIGVLGVCGVVFLFQEPSDYTVDESKGWEYVPGYFSDETYRLLSMKWHPLGRTDIYQFLDSSARDYLYGTSPVTFQINVNPPLEFSYFSTNFLSGTPAYHYAALRNSHSESRVELFSQDIELPYLLVKNPRVFVIGAGGGRDIFMAKTHGAQQVVGAEINPATFQAMKSGGILYEYTDRVYGDGTNNTKVLNIDGRNLVRQYPEKSFDLVIINGVDTFSGLSSGAYAYAESYLYTKNAVKDYFRILSDHGVLNLNRWMERPPRETLRLHAIALEALKEMGVKEPTEHIAIIGTWGWSIFLVKKSIFTQKDKEDIVAYISNHKTSYMVYPSIWMEQSNDLSNPFDIYARSFKEGLHKGYEALYPYDISVVSDDAPFFYKYYRLDKFNPFKLEREHHTGTVIFMTQLLILVQTIVFVALFMIIPLLLSKRNKLKLLPSGAIIPFISFFSALGFGFMFIEIPIMQRFVLILGSPIYSLTFVLAILLIATGVGSGLLPWLKRKLNLYERIIILSSCFTVGFLIMLILGADIISNFLLPLSRGLCMFLIGLILFPLGVCLGTFFPSGLHFIEEKYSQVVPWAWALNCGFSVLGSVMAIIIAQFLGFNFVLALAAVVYLIALFAFLRLGSALKN